MTGDDYERLGDDAESLTTWIGNEAFMRIENAHCIALSIDPASPTPFTCRVYERRPTICRDLERGSAACLGEIHTKHGLVTLQLRKPSESKKR